MNKKYLVVLVAAVALAGCASNGSKNSSEGATPAPVSSTSGMGTNTGMTPAEIAAEQAAALAKSLESNKVYFAFDKTDINADGEAVIANYGKYLVANPTAKVRLEGNTDERGSRAYNMALGERRANAVKSELVTRGVAADQTSVISYGEERPVCREHNEDCWHQNRRVDIIRQ